VPKVARRFTPRRIRASLPPEIIYAVRLPTWQTLFATHGEPPGVARATAEHR
jgi:hypothetical protein